MVSYIKQFKDGPRKCFIQGLFSYQVDLFNDSDMKVEHGLNYFTAASLCGAAYFGRAINAEQTVIVEWILSIDFLPFSCPQHKKY